MCLKSPDQGNSISSLAKEQKVARKEYQSPTVTEYGGIADLTRSGGFLVADAGLASGVE